MRIGPEGALLRFHFMSARVVSGQPRRVHSASALRQAVARHGKGAGRWRSAKAEIDTGRGAERQKRKSPSEATDI